VVWYGLLVFAATGACVDHDVTVIKVSHRILCWWRLLVIVCLLFRIRLMAQSMHLKIVGKTDKGELLWKAPNGQIGNAVQWANLGTATAKKP
jgi:hypothetical protein